MLKKIFGSGARVKLLKQFLKNPQSEFFVRELTRLLDEQINSLRRELENLENIGLLKFRNRNRKKYYFVNPHFVLLSELTSMIRKSDENNDEILKTINNLGSCDLIILGGCFIDQPEQKVDVFVVGDLDEQTLKEQLERHFTPVKEYRVGVITKEDFLYRLALKDKFIREMFADKSRIILKNKLKKDTEEFISL